MFGQEINALNPSQNQLTKYTKRSNLRSRTPECEVKPLRKEDSINTSKIYLLCAFSSLLD